MLLLKDLNTLPLPLFRQLGVLYCRRVAHLTTDRRFFKALRKLELSLGPPPDERLCRDAYNAACSAYVDIRGRDPRMSVEAAAVCVLVSACQVVANSGIRGNLQSALMDGESLSWDQIDEVEDGLLRQIDFPLTPAPAPPPSQ